MEGPNSEEDKYVDVMDLPPGFRFHPTDQELISDYLKPKITDGSFSAVAVGEVDLNKCEPWDLPGKAKMGEKEWYFFCSRDRKYPTGTRTNRATKSGYWKATGKDKEIYQIGKVGCLIGMKKTLVFYKGRAPKGEKTNWVMHEYRLEGEFSYYKFPNKDEWVISRIFHKNCGINRNHSIFPISNNPYNYDPRLLEDCSTISPLPLLVEYPAGSSLIDEDDTTEGITKASFPLSVYREEDDNLSYLSVNLEDDQLQKYNYIDHFTPHNYNYSVNYLPQSPSPSFANQAFLRASGETGTSFNVGKKCKEENLSSNQSMVSVSHDTAVTTDTTVETSSSRLSDGIYEFSDINDLTFNGPNISDGFDRSWDY